MPKRKSPDSRSLLLSKYDAHLRTYFQGDTLTSTNQPIRNSLLVVARGHKYPIIRQAILYLAFYIADIPKMFR